MSRRPPESSLTGTLFPYTTFFRSNPCVTLRASETGVTPAGYVSNNEFKRVQGKVAWTDATGATQEVALESAIAALSPQDTARIAKVSSTGGPRDRKSTRLNSSH